MRFHSLVACFLAGIASSGPARRDCGQEKCYGAVNDCGMTYGGCWTECANGLKEMPTFTAPLCSSDIDTAASTKTDAPVQTSSATVPADISSAKSTITTPPYPYPTKVKTRTCSPLWLCIDYIAVCGNSTQMYGGCYDVCTSAPPYTSPPCTLPSSTAAVDLSTTTTESSTTESAFSTTTSGYAIFIPTPEPGAAYTTEPPADNIAPAIDDKKALVMAEMPKADAGVPDAGEFRIAHVASEQALEAPALIEAPQSLRGAAIAKLMADKQRKPNTENKPCWDSPTCKEVQLGIPSPLPSSVEPSSEAASAPTAEPVAEPQPAPEPSADAPTENPAEDPADPPAETPVEASPETPTEPQPEPPTEPEGETPAEPQAESPAEPSAEGPSGAPAEI